MTESYDKREQRRNCAANSIVVLGLAYVAFLRPSGEPANCRAVETEAWLTYEMASDLAAGMVAAEFGISPEEVREKAAVGPVECQEGLRPEEISFVHMSDIEGTDGNCIGSLDAGPDGVVEETSIRSFRAVCIRD